MRQLLIIIYYDVFNAFFQYLESCKNVNKQPESIVDLGVINCLENYNFPGKPDYCNKNVLIWVGNNNKIIL